MAPAASRAKLLAAMRPAAAVWEGGSAEDEDDGETPPAVPEGPLAPDVGELVVVAVDRVVGAAVPEADAEALADADGELGEPEPPSILMLVSRPDLSVYV